MAVDEQRVQAVFRAAAAAADAVEQAAILGRECASDAELRERVEALLRASQEPAGAPGAARAALVEGTQVFGAVSHQEGPSPGVAEQDVATEHDGPTEGEGLIALDFLEPSTKPGSLGRLGHHEVLKVLGKGGFGIVVRAFDETLQRVVAIKVLSPQLASTSPARKRFLREARAAARVRHENVVQIYAVAEQPLPYIVMEYIPGQTLQQRLNQTGPMEVPDILRIGGQIARGLAAAHQQGLIHRDIKPANILLESTVEHKVKITDFGLARAADDASLSQSGVIAGTPLYMAPEQARGEPLDPRADLFSLGTVLYTMASGRPPFRAGTALAVLKRVAEDTPRPIHEIIPEVPQWLCDLIARLHAKAPAQRFQSAATVAALLEQQLAHLRQPSLVAQPEIVEAPRQRRPSRLALLAAAALLLVILGTVLSYLLWRDGEPSGHDNGEGQVQTPAATPADRTPAEQLRRHVLQGRAVVRDALIDFGEPDRSFGAEAQDNAVRRADQCNAFLVRFDLDKLRVPPKAQVAKATLSFYVWDPSSSGKAKVCAFPLKTAWDEATVTWRHPAAGKSWRGGASFAFSADTGPASPAVIVLPDQGSDTVDPPLEYQLDVTDLVRAWLTGRTSNDGLAIASVIDPSVDEGFASRFQVYGSEHSRAEYTPKLTVQVR
jgi:serine/threonine protein kinase